MNKKKTLLLLTTIATSLAVGTIALMPHDGEASFFALNSAKRGVTNSLTISNNLYLLSSTYKTYRVVTSNGNYVKLCVRGEYSTFAQDAKIRLTGTGYINIEKEDTTYHAITGIESITVNYVRCPDYISAPNVTEAGQAGDLSIQCGYVDSSGNLLYESARSVSPREALDLSDVSPRYFKLNKAWNATNSAILIQSITINYTCSESIDDKSILDSKFDSIYATDPVKNGNIWTYGYYPQTLVDPDSEVGYKLYSLYDESWTKLTNGYYFVNNKAYARVQAKSTGYNNEYVIDDYYWFEVEPVTWKYLDSKYNKSTLKKLCNVVVSEKVLGTSVFDVAGNNPTSYTVSTALGQFMNELYNNMLPASKSTRIYNYELSGGPENYSPYTGMFPLTYTTLYDSDSKWGLHNQSDRIAYSTDYARSQEYDFLSSGYAESDGKISMHYWSRSFSSGKPWHVRADGGCYTSIVEYSNYIGVRPACRIVESGY